MARGFGRLKAYKSSGADLYIPRYFLNHPKFPFENGAIIQLDVKGNEVVMSEPKWYLILDWDKMPDAYKQLPKDIQEEIRQYKKELRETTIIGQSHK